MTHNFKPGDKITMKPGAKSRYGTDLRGKTGVVKYAEAYGSYPLDVTFEGLPFSRYCVRPEDVLLAEDDTAKIKAALAVVKDKGGYCSDFDRAVEEAENLDLLGRLKAVASKKVKWPAGSIVQDRSRPLVIRSVNKDVYEGDGTFEAGFAYYGTEGYQRVEITVAG